MLRKYLIIQFSLIIVTTVTLILPLTGCGSSSDADEINVRTGSLSKAEFIERADAICEVFENRFSQEYSAILERHGLGGSESEQEALIAEIVDTALLPNYEKGINQISILGAPSRDEEEIANFLNALQQRLDEIHDAPLELSSAPEPFKKAAKMAKSYGLNGCAESFV